METETVRRRRFVSLFPRWDEAIGVFGVVHVSLGVGGDRCCSSLGRRQRQGLPGRELDRIRRQQQFLRSLVGERRGEVDLTDPLGIVRVLDTITRAVGVYDRMSNSDRRDLVFGLRHLDASDTRFGAAPIVRSEMIRGHFALILDRREPRAQ